MRLTCFTLALLTTMTASPASASTAAFCGTVTEVKPAAPNHKDTHAQFTVEIDYFDYISWGKFGRDSKVGESITRQVKRLGTVCVINGRLVNAATFVNAMRPQRWGYFYEDTWLDLQTTPNFQWGEVVETGANTFVLRTHRTHKDIHLESNPPQNVTVSFGNETSFRVESKEADAATALKPRNWVQVHEPRSQIISVWAKDSTFDPKELLPAEEGQRGYANDLTCPAVLGAVSTKTPEQVIDLSAEVTATRVLKGKEETVTLDARKVTFILDGKPAPPSIAARAGRQAVLCHYRKETRPHKILVRSHDDAVRGTIVSMDGQKMRIKTSDGEVTVAVEQDASYQINGAPADLASILFEGKDVVVSPKRGRTCIAFTPQP